MRRSRLVGLALLALLSSAACSPRPLSFVVTFKDARGLQAGDGVLTSGVSIGKVTRVDLQPGGGVDVQVRIDGQHAALVRERCRFHVEPPTPTRDRDKSLAMTAPPDAGAPIVSGQTVSGDEPVDLGAGAQELGRKFLDALESARTSSVAKELGKNLTSFADSLAARGRRLNSSDLDSLKRRGEEFARKLDEAGHSQQAAQARRQLASWLDRAAKGLAPDSTHGAPPVSH